MRAPDRKLDFAVRATESIVLQVWTGGRMSSTTFMVVLRLRLWPRFVRPRSPQPSVQEQLPFEPLFRRRFREGRAANRVAHGCPSQSYPRPFLSPSQESPPTDCPCAKMLSARGRRCLTLIAAVRIGTAMASAAALGCSVLKTRIDFGLVRAYLYRKTIAFYSARVRLFRLRGLRPVDTRGLRGLRGCRRRRGRI